MSSRPTPRGARDSRRSGEIPRMRQSTMLIQGILTMRRPANRSFARLIANCQLPIALVPQPPSRVCHLDRRRRTLSLSKGLRRCGEIPRMRQSTMPTQGILTIPVVRSQFGRLLCCPLLCLASCYLPAANCLSRVGKQPRRTLPHACGPHAAKRPERTTEKTARSPLAPYFVRLES